MKPAAKRVMRMTAPLQDMTEVTLAQIIAAGMPQAILQQT